MLSQQIAARDEVTVSTRRKHQVITKEEQILHASRQLLFPTYSDLNVYFFSSDANRDSILVQTGAFYEIIKAKSSTFTQMYR